MIKPIREKWPGRMTERERFNAQMHYLPFDRTVNMEFGYWDENFHTWSMFRDNGIVNNEQADQFFGFDRMPFLMGGIWMNPRLKRPTTGKRSKPSDSGWKGARWISRLFVDFTRPTGIIHWGSMSAP